MEIVGREKEIQELNNCYASGEPEFVVVYGRRRIGKTFLIRSVFGNRFDFYVTGLANAPKEENLRTFGDAIRTSFKGDAKTPEDWLSAFSTLRDKLENKPTKKRKVLFIDEIPWMDTPRSGFLTALEWFWNGWASGRADIMLIVCGSSSSWVVNNLLKNRGGLHNRATRRIRLLPFTLGETERYLDAREIEFGRYRTAEAYMVFGGVPYYLSLFGRGLSLPQNIDALCFSDTGALVPEFEEVYASLFRYSENYIKVIRALGAKARGLTRNEIVAASGISSGGGMSKILEELEQSGFVRSYADYQTNENLRIYQLVDFFSLFHLRFMSRKRGRNPHYWTSNQDSASLAAWRGYAFERLCLLHAESIKKAIGVSAVSTEMSSWRSRKSSPGAQIDLVIDRRDGIVNLCEAKFSVGKFAITADYEKKLRNKLAVFAKETRSKKALHLTMVTTYGLERNKYAGLVASEVTLDDLFV